MSDIRWISLSDLHLGERNSLLSDVHPGTLDVNPLSASPTMEALVDCLRALVGDQDSKPTLVLHGDILEFATAPATRALMVFERFVELTLVGPDALFDQVVYVPGNHDHHIWVSARETQYVEGLKNRPTGTEFPEDRHATRAFAGVEPPVQRVRADRAHPALPLLEGRHDHHRLPELRHRALRREQGGPLDPRALHRPPLPPHVGAQHDRVPGFPPP